MKRVAVFYATREGHTAKVARYVANVLRSHRLDVDLINVAAMGGPAELYCYSGAVLAASVHTGRHESEMVHFVQRYRGELERIPTAFLSVSLSEAGVEDPRREPAERLAFLRDVHKMVDTFLHETHWHPEHVKPVAGAIAYTQYNPVIRFVMKQIAKKAGADTDTSRDFEYTDWSGLNKFCEELAVEFGESQPDRRPVRSALLPHVPRRASDYASTQF